MKDIYVVGKKVTKNGCKMAKLKICHFFYGPVFSLYQKNIGAESTHLYMAFIVLEDGRELSQLWPPYYCTTNKANEKIPSNIRLRAPEQKMNVCNSRKLAKN